jgi:sulfate adenylyltransferase
MESTSAGVFVFGRRSAAKNETHRRKIQRKPAKERIAMNPPHGGKLVNRLATGQRAADLEASARDLPVITLNAFEVSDLEMVAIGAFSPLEGFMTRADLEAVVRRKRLANGLVWTLPVALAVTEEQARALSAGERAVLAGPDGERLAILEIEDRFHFDRQQEAQEVFRTTETRHPGVQYLYSRGEVYLGGRIELFRRPSHPFSQYRLDPSETRRIFDARAWSTVVGFQTRNPVHRAHEYIQKMALEIVDGLLLHPIAGETKSDDLSLEVRLRCYEVLIENYYPRDRVLLALNPASMRYAGPREAVFHALIRKNFGCTHFIVGRDHAGVGGYYGPYDAQKIFDEFTPRELGITPLFFEHTFYCRSCDGVASPKTCGHRPEARIILSGTEVRTILREGGRLPREFTRPEVAQILHEAFQAHSTG